MMRDQIVSVTEYLVSNCGPTTALLAAGAASPAVLRLRLRHSQLKASRHSDIVRATSVFL